ncbi:MAG TPA: aminopeptidase [Aggregatilineales bacterium]|nr:aminopeptidase [Anaerolineales bacterium]HRE46901.1 aminopeptidase [Aggregatilineales bacterium]
MPDPRVVNLARTLVEYSVAVQPGETVFLTGEVVALPLIRETYKYVVQAGGRCIPYLLDEDMTDTLTRLGTDDQLEWISPLEDWIAKDAKVLINIRATNNTRRSSSINPQRGALRAKARAELAKIRFARSASGDQRWTLTQFPTEAYAQEADMSLTEFEDFVYGATFADQPDPIRLWKELGKNQQKYVDWLKGKKNVHVHGPNIDMTLSIEGRTFVNSEGTHNMPSGEIFTGPVEDSVNGWVRFTYPAIREGRIVDGVELRFEQGKVVHATAKKNEEYLLTQLASDPGAKYLGEWAIGTNFGIQRFTGNILFDEKIGGTIHMALGRGYPETGSVNESSIHWDMICDMRNGSEIVVDGELFYKNGQFTF